MLYPVRCGGGRQTPRYRGDGKGQRHLGHWSLFRSGCKARAPVFAIGLNYDDTPVFLAVRQCVRGGRGAAIPPPCLHPSRVTRWAALTVKRP